MLMCWPRLVYLRKERPLTHDKRLREQADSLGILFQR